MFGIANNSRNNVCATEWKVESCLTESLHLDTSKSRRLNFFSIKWSPVSRSVDFIGSSSDGLVAILHIVVGWTLMTNLSNHR